MVTRASGSINFEIFSIKENRVLKVFKYKVNHRDFISVICMFVGPILYSLSDRLDSSFDTRTDSVLKTTLNQFEEDLAETLKNDKILLSKFIASAPSIYALIPIQHYSPEVKEIFDGIYKNLESTFLERKMKLVEKEKIDKIKNEINYSENVLTIDSIRMIKNSLNPNKLIFINNIQVIKYDNTKLSIDEIEFQIRLMDLNTGSILWNIPCRYLVNDFRSMEENIKWSVHDEIKKLIDSGEI